MQCTACSLLWFLKYAINAGISPLPHAGEELVVKRNRGGVSELPESNHESGTDKQAIKRYRGRKALKPFTTALYKNFDIALTSSVFPPRRNCGPKGVDKGMLTGTS